MKTDKIVEFKAPTGSGKTLMASQFISKLIANFRESQFIFIIATLSSAELPEAFERKIKDYRDQGILEITNFEVEYYASPSSSKNSKQCEDVPPIKCEKNKVYIFGKSSFGRKKLYTELNIIDAFIQEAAKDYTLIYIRDEAHVGTGTFQKERANFEALMDKHAAFILKMTATFDKEYKYPRVEITEKELEENGAQTGQYLLKCTPEVLENETYNDSNLINQAIEKFKEIKAQYQKLWEKEGVWIAPAMLIQVDNQPDQKSNPDAWTKWDKTLQELKDKFEQVNWSWVQYFGDEIDYNRRDNDLPKSVLLPKISKINDTTDCIIFKVGPATGWDIPRACMLLRLRNVCSSKLSIQALGRIKRNPYPQLEKHGITDKYFLYENFKNSKDYTVYSYKIKDSFKGFKVLNIALELTPQHKEIQTEKKRIKQFIQNHKQQIYDQSQTCFEQGIYRLKHKKFEILNIFELLRRACILKRNLNAPQGEILKKILKNLSNAYPNTPCLRLEMILLEFYIYKIYDIYNASLQNQKTYTPHLETYQPPEIVEEKSQEPKTCSFDPDYYLVEIKKDGKKIEEVPLDSTPEQKIFAELDRFVMKNEQDIKVWFKNSSKSNAYIEYLDDSGNKHTSHPDFVMQFKNGYFVYIEIKSGNDINPTKTALLERAYQEYFTQENSTRVTTALVLCIYKYEEENPKLLRFYDKSNVHLNPIEETGTELKSMLEVIKKAPRIPHETY
ncbi:DEAD/DEAH box helicase family protein [Helicobacter suis]|uniref:DEAD/DEAH box helicase family protein n=1 Tax=Helicobacter suis TaxID=104628 RepID=UPI0013D3D445